MAKDTLKVAGIVVATLVVISLAILFLPSKISAPIGKYVMGQG